MRVCICEDQDRIPQTNLCRGRPSRALPSHVPIARHVQRLLGRTPQQLMAVWASDELFFSLRNLLPERMPRNSFYVLLNTTFNHHRNINNKIAQVVETPEGYGDRGITVTVYRIALCRYSHPASRLKDAQVWRGSRALLRQTCPTMSPSAAIGASRCFSRPTTVASIAGSSPRRCGAPVQPSGLID